ncbi:hypothetical protein ACFV8Z_09875 [Streptomyces sp. NPDC059837]|uniref:hypothetical protein n=1 Tax=unclassified Streptomyces TaxID=2593676 RepID=UPI00365B32A6
MSQISSLGFTDADLTPRLKFVNILPSLVFMVTVGSLWLSGAPENPPDFSVLMKRAGHYGWPGAVLITAGSLIVGLLLQPLELASIRFLEGYWRPSGPLGRLGEFGRWVQERRKTRLTWLRDHLSDGPHAEFAKHVPGELALLPDKQEVLPTALGNRLRAAEERAGRPYSLDAILTWPRLYFVLPQDVLRVVAQSRNELDTAVRLCISFALTAVVSTGLLLRHPVWLALPGGFALLSALAYRAALHAAEDYGVTFTAVIDVYRLRLLREMSVKMPEDSAAEQAINHKISQVWGRKGRLRNPVPYAPGEGAGPSGSAG